MKYFITLIAFFLSLTLSAQSFFDKSNEFMSQYVENGAVDYQAIKHNPAQLNELVNDIATLNLRNKRVTPDYLKAFYINSYNLLVIRQVVDLYPINGPLEVDGFFDAIKHEVMGEQLTLNQLEKEVLYAQFPDPRLHFVLVCAAKGCPPLASYSYRPDILDKQLNDRTSTVLNLDWFIRVNKTEAEISRIFDWYEQDFKKSTPSVRSFINQYRDQNISENKTLKFYKYDWQLNKQ